MDLKQVCLCVLVLSLEFVCCQYSSTLCSSPGIFDFESDGANVYGRIVLVPTEPVSTLVVRINFTVAAQLFGNYVGRIEAEDGTALLQKYNRGEPVRYRVHFPVTSPLPKLTALTANENMLCYGRGDVPKPNAYVTTFSLQHSSFLQSGGNRVVYSDFRPQNRPPPRPQPPLPDPVQDLINSYGDDGEAHIYTFNNIEPTWGTGNSSPYYVTNTSRPYTPSTQPMYPPPTQQVYQQPTQQVFQPSSPVFDQNQYKPYDVITTKPVYYDRPPITNRPAVYQPPEAIPQNRPGPEEDLYNLDRVTARPTSMVTERPLDPQRDEAITTNECGTISGGNDNLPLIYNGESYPRGELPWLVAVYRNSGGTIKFICGGTLVSNRHVVTAGHCLQSRSKRTSIKEIVVKVGVHNLNDWGDDITITRTLISAAVHQEYADTPALINDISVFTLNKRVEFNKFIRPACLWNGNTDLARVVGDTGVVAGWGDQFRNGGGQGEPHRVRIPIVSTTTCRASKPNFYQLTSSTTFCAGNRDGSGPCLGDSGGGLFLLEGGQWRLRGVVSISLRAANGDANCNLDEYVIFTDAAQYLPWIRSVMAENFFD